MMAVSNLNTNISKYISETNSYEFYRQQDLPQGIIQVDAIGFACVLIKVSSLRKLKYPFFVYTEYEDTTVLSEDLYFCHIVRQNDLVMLCDTSLKIGHIKTIII